MNKKDIFNFLETPKGKMFLNVIESNGNKFNTIHAHLIFEEIMTELLLDVFCHNKGLESAKLQFHQKLHLVYALKGDLLSHQLYGGLKKLNKIRNSYAHTLNPNGVTELEEDLISTIPKEMFPDKEPFILNKIEIEQTYSFNEKYVVSLNWLFEALINITNQRSQ